MAEKAPYSKTVGYALLHAARLHRARMAQLLAELGLFPGQDQVLTTLAAEDGRTIGDLASVLRVRPPTASKAIGRLTAQGLVERRSSPGDARIVRVHLTEEGRRRATAVKAVWRILEDEAVELLDRKDKKRLRRGLGKIAKSLNAAAGNELDPDVEDMGDDEEA
jgi:DNA-binding MarR family transcriptional regulator